MDATTIWQLALDYLLSMKEVEQFGFNSTTNGFIGTTITTTMYAVAIKWQRDTVRLEKSGQSVPSGFILYFTVMFFASFVYGFYLRSLAQIYLGVATVPLQIHLIFLLFKYKRGGFKKSDIAMSIAALVATAAIVTFPEHREPIFMSILLGATFPRLQMPFELIREKATGVLEVGVIFTSWITSLWWLVYGWGVMDWPIIVGCLVGFITYCWALWLWLKYYFRELHEELEALRIDIN